MVRGLGLHGFNHGDEGRLPMVDRQKNLLVVVAGIAWAVDQQEPELAGVSSDAEVRAGAGVGVISARSGGVRREAVPQVPARWDHGRAFFHGAVVQRVGCQPVPVHDVGGFSGIGYVDGDGHALAEAQ